MSDYGLDRVAEKLDLMHVELQEMNSSLNKLNDMNILVMKLTDAIDKVAEAVNRAVVQL